jgi:dUTPase
MATKKEAFIVCTEVTQGFMNETSGGVFLFSGGTIRLPPQSIPIKATVLNTIKVPSGYELMVVSSQKQAEMGVEVIGSPILITGECSFGKNELTFFLRNTTTKPVYIMPTQVIAEAFVRKVQTIDILLEEPVVDIES